MNSFLDEIISTAFDKIVLIHLLRLSYKIELAQPINIRHHVCLRSYSHLIQHGQGTLAHSCLTMGPGKINL
jgi:hypothetical protein